MRNVSPQIRLVPGPRDMGLRDGDADRLKFAAVAAELAGAGAFGQTIENMLGEKFCGRIAAREVRHVVEIAIVEGPQYGLERVMGAANVDHDPVAVERFGDEGCVDDEGRAVQRLGRAEDGAAE